MRGLPIPGYYLSQHADLVNAFGPTNYLAALIHWQSYGLAEGRTAHRHFSPALYLSRYPDLQAACGSTNYRAAIVHYLTLGMYEVVVPPARDITLRVTGLEACDAPDAGGFCATPP